MAICNIKDFHSLHEYELSVDSERQVGEILKTIWEDVFKNNVKDYKYDTLTYCNIVKISKDYHHFYNILKNVHPLTESLAEGMYYIERRMRKVVEEFFDSLSLNVNVESINGNCVYYGLYNSSIKWFPNLKREYKIKFE